ncbi:unnamed protein product [Pieris brassicae]|uniref:Uncharacterized protein n=1 Tax=Pieris brassicae TaxID=7116 RepID=A0A9P0TYU4_PIEBR|nr:unnamed protein product [Pieris brassicae]
MWLSTFPSSGEFAQGGTRKKRGHPFLWGEGSGVVAALDDVGRHGRAGWWAPPPVGHAAGNTSAPMRGMYLERADITEK